MRNYLSMFILLVPVLMAPLPCSAKLVIADGGGSGYVMENNLAATSLAVAMDADLIKLDLVLSKDNNVLVFSSPYLEFASDVAEVYPERVREDGHFYVLDFSTEEIRQLTLQDPENRIDAELQPRFTITTLNEQLSLIRSLEKSLGKEIRIAVALVKPWLHKKEGRDLSSRALTILQQYGYSGQKDNLFLLSYDVDELRRIAEQLAPQKQMHIKLVQLIDHRDGQEHMVEEWGKYRSYNYDWIFSNSGLRSLGRTVAAIGLPKYMLVDAQGQLRHADFVANAQKLGTMIFTFPLQKNKQTRLSFTRSFEEELEFLLFTAGVDGIVTDFCYDASQFLKNRTQNPQNIRGETPLLPHPGPTGIDPLNITSPIEL